MEGIQQGVTGAHNNTVAGSSHKKKSSFHREDIERPFIQNDLKSLWFICVICRKYNFVHKRNILLEGGNN